MGGGEQFAIELKARVGQGDVAKTCMEMELPPREREPRPEKILSLQSILMKQLKTDERGLPLQLDEVVEREVAREVTRETAKVQHLERVLREREAALHGADSAESAAAAAALDKPLAEVRVHVVEAIRPHTWPNAAAEANFLYCTFSVHHQDKPGTQVRTAMCEARPNLAFPPVSIQVYHLPAQIMIELIAWAGADAQPDRVASSSVFVTAGPFDVDTAADKTVRIDEPADDWFKLVSTGEWDSGKPCDPCRRCE